MNIILFVPVFFGFLISFLALPFWINRAKKVGLSGRDMNKFYAEKIAEAGGVCIVLGFVAGVLLYVAIKTFYFHDESSVIEILSLISMILMVSFIGFSDDILGWKIGLTKSVRIVLLVFASFPLIVINAGQSQMFGIEWGLVYPLFFIPLGIVGASSTFNFLAGYNGLESSQGIILLAGLSVANFLIGNSWLSVIGLVMIVCLSAFYIFNKYPAKVFPGNILTYSTGALIAGIAILGGIEKIAVIFFIPYILEVALKIRGHLKKESFAKANEDGSIAMPYEKIYGIEHLAIKILKKIKPSKKIYEKDVVYLINFFQIVIVVLGFVLFRGEFFI